MAPINSPKQARTTTETALASNDENVDPFATYANRSSFRGSMESLEPTKRFYNRPSSSGSVQLASTVEYVHSYTSNKPISMPSTPNGRRRSHVSSTSPRKSVSKTRYGFSPSKSSLVNDISFKTNATMSPARSSVQSRYSSPNRRNSSVNAAGSNGIKVIARFRPENEKEAFLPDSYEQLLLDGKPLVEFLSDTSIMFNLKDQVASFTFDRIFASDATQQDIYNYSIHETVTDVFQGYNGTILAYGQTGSGKTYTMMGNDIYDKEKRGLIPRIAETIFDLIMLSSSDIEYTVSVSYMEIYMEKIRDLLDSHSSLKHLSIHEDKENGVHVKGLETAYVTCPEDLYSIMKEGSNSRAVAATNMNQESSRSHAIFQIVVTQKVISSGLTKRGNLFLVDLAGSEKVAKTGASGQTLEEAKKINSSLSSLGNVINALTDGKSQHIPYRDSKLTRILQESLGGNSRTSLIINCSPSFANANETLSTLRFGARAKKIKNKAHVNTEIPAKELKRSIVKLTKENQQKDVFIEKLITEIQQWRAGSASKDWADLTNNSNAFHQDILSDLGEHTFEDLYDQLNNTKITKDAELLKENEALREEIAEARRIASEQAVQQVNAETLQEVKSQLTHYRTEIEYLKSQLDIEKLANASLVADIKEKTTKCVSLDLEVENLRSQLRKKALSRNEKQKILALERTLDQFAHKVDDMLMQNNLLKRDIVTTRKIAETRNERIKILENTIKEQNLQVHKESFIFEKKLDDLSKRLSDVKKIGTDSFITSPMSDSKFDYSSLMSPKTPLASHQPDLSYYGLDNTPIDAFGIKTVTSTPNNETPKALLVSPEINNAKKGLNFRIVKPLRGGNAQAAPQNGLLDSPQETKTRLSSP